MALPSKETIRQLYLEGKWTDRMLQTALTCKAITQADYDKIRAEKQK